ncbi:MAG: AAA family ATPase [Phycisphaerales bacterium]
MPPHNPDQCLPLTLILNAEDDPADTARARLVAAGAVLSRVHTADAREQPSLFSLDRVHSLAAALEALPACRLVVIDPVTAYFPDGRDSHKQTDVRRVLAPLADLAQRRAVTILLVAHLNKDAMAPEVYRVSGSTALPAACRAVWSVWRDPDDPELRLFKPIKLNLARDGGVRRYRLAETQTPEGTPKIVWEAGGGGGGGGGR